MAQQVEILSLNIDTKALLTKLSETKKTIEQLQASQKELTKAGEGTSTTFIQQAAQIKALQGAYNSQLNVVTQLTAADKAAATATEAVTTALNKEITSIDAATENNKQLKTVRNQLNLATDEGRAALEAINKKMNENTAFIKENASASEQLKMNIGNYTESIIDAYREIEKEKKALEDVNKELVEQRNVLGKDSEEWKILNQQINNNITQINVYASNMAEARGEQEGFGDALSITNGGLAGFAEKAAGAGGAGNLLKQTFGQLTSGIASAGKAAMSFIATPIGAAIAGITAAFATGKAIFDYNAGLSSANKELKALGVNAGQLSNVRSEISATADTFDKDFKDIASKANSLAKAYGISMSEANDIIAQGLASGGAMNDEFLDSIGEYDALFAQAGYSAQEFVNIVNQGYELGIYADKLPDAIKEVGIKLTEQATATRDTLTSAFGASFTEDVLQKVRTGEMTTKQALDSIAEKSTEVSLTQQQQAALTADIFSSAGEDAGGAAKIFEAISKSANKELDSTAKAQLELVDSTERLSKAQAELYEVKGLGDVWTGIKVVATDALSATLEHLAGMKKDLQPLIDLVSIVFVNAWQQLKTTVSVIFNVIKGGFAIIGNTIGTFFNFFKALVTGDFQGAIDALKNGFTNLLNIVSNTFGKIKNNIIDGLKSIIDNVTPVLEALGVDVEKLSKKLEGLKSKNVDIKATSTTTDTTVKKDIVKDIDPNSGAKAKAAADATKAAIDEQAKAVDALIKKQKEEIDLYIAGQDIKKKSIQDQLAIEQQIMNKRLALNELEFSKGKISKEQYETQKLTITNTYLGKQADATVAVAAQELEQYKSNIEKKKADDTFFTEEKLAAKQAENNALAEKEVAYQTTRLEQGVINQQEFNTAIDAINDANRLKNDEAENLRIAAKKEQEAIDLANQQILDEEKFTNDFDIQLEKERIKYEAEMKDAEKTGADKSKITKKYAKVNEDIEKLKEAAIRDQYAQTFGQAAQLLGEKTAAGKAAAIAEATMNTYNGVTQVWAADSLLPEPAATIAKGISTAVVLASGLSAVKKITSTKTSGFADGGIIPTLGAGLINNGSNIIPMSNGDDTLAYVGQGEVILNRSQQQKAGGSAFFRNLGVPGFAGGGFVGGNSNVGMQANMSIDMDLLAAKIGEQVGKANQQLPTPVVQIDSITEAQSNQNRIQVGASF